MKPAVVFADPEAVMVAHLTFAWADREESFAPTRVAVDFPDDTLIGADTRIQVDAEPSNLADYPVTERAQIRVVCHAAPGARSTVKALASLTQSLAYQHPGNAEVAGVFLGTGRSDVITDPDTGNLMCWFTVRVALKAMPHSALVDGRPPLTTPVS